MPVKLIANLPAAAVGIEAAGKVTDSDYKDVLVPAVEEALRQGGKVRLLYVLGPEFEGYEAGAMWDDAKLGLSHLGSWERIAVVTSHSVYANMVKAFAIAMPGEVKVYPMAQLDEAKSWVSGS